MKTLSFAAALAGLASVAQAAVSGFDISGWQSSTDFAKAYAAGDRFVYIKATEGTTYKSPMFSSQYTGATNAGFIRGAYHFAQPASSSGAAQATYFAANGGGWSADGITLPGALDMEYNPSGATCYGLSASAMVNWIEDFVTTYHSKTSRWPVIYTSTSKTPSFPPPPRSATRPPRGQTTDSIRTGWWTTCTGNSAQFADRSPLWVARYASSVGTLPAGWGFYTIWQFNDAYSQGGDSNTFNGDLSRLKALASNTA
ncbi:hypothetical protein ACO1O0_009397 [Amphichorda felina]